MEFELSLAVPGDLSALPTIEERAATLFANHPLDAILAQVVETIRDFAAAEAEGLLWVARIGGTPIGFALVERSDDGLHLEELDVLPEHGRKGVGAALVRTVCATATARLLPRVTLCTFRGIPWNEAFYARLGFRALPDEGLSPSLRARVEAEDARGLPRALRVAMVWESKI